MENIAHLKSRSLLSLTGSETVPFLQNLVTCNIENLENGDVTFGALLTPQGKILFDFFVFREADGLIIDVDGDQRDALMKRLTFYKLRADVSISIDERQIYVSWPVNPGEPATDPRCPLLGRRILAAKMNCNCDEGEWHDIRIAAGVPQSGIDFELGTLFPHDALMDQFDEGGVDFAKGCYVGQEVVSRMQHRGTARKRFVIARSAADDLPATGTDIVAAEKTTGKMAGNRGRNGLALVRVDRVEAAMAAGNEFTADTTQLTLHRPEFANFSWPQ